MDKAISASSWLNYTLHCTRVLQRVAVACREPSLRYTAGVPVVYLAWTDVIESGVMGVSQVNNNLVFCLLFLFARFCVRWSGSHVDL